MAQKDVSFIRNRSGLIIAHFRYYDQVLRYSTQISVDPENWTTGEPKKKIKNRRVLETDNDHSKKNAELDRVKDAILTIYKSKKRDPLSLENFKLELDKYLDREKKEPQPPVKPKLDVLQAFRDFIDHHKEYAGKPDTSRSFNTISLLFQRYADYRGWKRIEFEDLNKKFYTEFTGTLKQGKLPAPTLPEGRVKKDQTPVKYSDAYVGRAIRVLKIMLNDLWDDNKEFRKYIGQYPPWREKYFKSIRKSGKSEAIYLTVSELDQLSNHKFKHPYLEKVRDQFIILAWTGQRYSDLDQLIPENIVTDSEGNKFFRFIPKKVEKYDTVVEVPVNYRIKKILEKYNNKLPRVITQQRFNVFLKKACKEAGMTQKRQIIKEDNGRKKPVSIPLYELIKSHTGRRSFISNAVLDPDIGITDIRDITGLSLKTLEMYDKTTSRDHAKKVLKSQMFQEPGQLRVVK